MKNLKRNVALVTGGNSGEYEISLKTAKNIETLLNKERFKTYLITVVGKSWSYESNDGTTIEVDKNDFSLLLPEGRILFDVAFIALHGDPGENGKLQSYFEMMEIPFTGCDSFVSALTFNKYFCNIAVKNCGIPIAPSLHYYDINEVNYNEIIETCGFPCFVKPCNSGSSVGVTKAQNEQTLQEAILQVFQIDNQVIIEKNIEGREFTCGVIKSEGKAMALAVTEIISKKEFYDYQAKYTPGFLEMVTPAKMDLEVEKMVKHYSEIIYNKLGCKGVVRLDFIVTNENNPYFLELNAIPGQTAMSIIPKQLQHCQIELNQFYASLIDEALSEK